MGKVIGVWLLVATASVVGVTSVADAGGGEVDVKPPERDESRDSTDADPDRSLDVVLPGGEFVAQPASPRPVQAGERLEGVFDEPTQGVEALDQLGDRLPAAAAQNGMSAEKLRQLLLHDTTAWLDRDAALFYAEADVEMSPGAEPVAPEPGPFPYPETFFLHSNPGSQRTIFLDFDGHTISGTAWQTSPGVPDPLVMLPFDSDGNSANFSNTELDAIQSIWQRVAEDYAPFDVNVTTEDPGDAAIDRASAADQVYGTRVAITSSPSICASTTGCAYRGVFDYHGANGHDYYQPAWAYSSGFAGADTKNVAEVTSHEAGHVVGLQHDGTPPCPLPNGSDPCEYYRGHAMWAPVMGSGYNEPVVQFSKGEYANADNTEDDFAVIASHGVVMRSDDHTNSFATATALTSADAGIVASENDYDLFEFTATATGTATFTALPAPVSPNLDIVLQLYVPDGAGGSTLLETAAPTIVQSTRDVATGMSATLEHALTAGTDYYIQVSGDSFGTASTGFTRYGSIGEYTISVQGPGSSAPVNDDFAAAIELLGASGAEAASNVGSSGETGEPDHAGSAPSTSVWWSFTAPGDGVLHADLEGSDFDTTLAVYTGPSVDSLSEVVSNDDVSQGVLWSSVDTGVSSGVTYRIAVDGYDGAEGAITLNWSFTPVNDDFGDATALAATSGAESGSNVGSSGEAGEPDHAGSAPSTSVWWSFAAPGDGVLHLDTEGSDFDTTLAVYTGPSVDVLAEAASNDDHPAAEPGSRWSVVDPSVSSGVVYAIVVDGWDGAEGSIALNWAFTSGSQMCGGLTVTVDLGLGQSPTDGPDVILGTDAVDVIDGLDGDDVICGLDGADTIDGGVGRDTIYGDDGADTIDGGQGVDTIFGGGGDDDLYGAGGSDVLRGDADDDLIRGGNGNDLIEGGAGADELRGQNGSDQVYANSAADFSTIDADTVYGGGLYDDVYGDAGDDLVYGGNFADVLSGKSGDDSLYGNNGADILRGGPDVVGDYCNGGVNNSGSGDVANACETIANVP